MSEIVARLCIFISSNIIRVSLIPLNRDKQRSTSSITVLILLPFTIPSCFVWSYLVIQRLHPMPMLTPSIKPDVHVHARALTQEDKNNECLFVSLIYRLFSRASVSLLRLSHNRETRYKHGATYGRAKHRRNSRWKT